MGKKSRQKRSQAIKQGRPKASKPADRKASSATLISNPPVQEENLVSSSEVGSDTGSSPSAASTLTSGTITPHIKGRYSVTDHEEIAVLKDANAIASGATAGLTVGLKLVSKSLAFVKEAPVPATVMPNDISKPKGWDLNSTSTPPKGDFSKPTTIDKSAMIETRDLPTTDKDSSSLENTEEEKPAKIPILGDGRMYFFPQAATDPAWHKSCQLGTHHPDVKKAPTTNYKSWAEIFDDDRYDTVEGNTIVGTVGAKSFRIRNRSVEKSAYKQATSRVAANIGYKGGGTTQTAAMKLLEKKSVCRDWLNGSCRSHESECSGSHPPRQDVKSKLEKMAGRWR